MRKHSAGILLFRRTPSIEVLLVHPGGPYWVNRRAHGFGVPKGEFEPGREEPIACARREFAEEMGSEAPHEDELEFLGQFAFGRKSIHVWIAEAGTS
jgi:predicted NUDIX family NTP pyrophosphohydrolase